MEGNESKTLNEAKIILISVVGTVLVLFATAYIFRSQIIQFVFTNIEEKIVDMVPEASEMVSDEDRVINAIKQVNPSVVSVIVSKDVTTYEQYYETVNPWGLFGGFSVPRIREKGTEEQEVGAGSGFIVSSNGLIVTNRHVVEDTEARYSVLLTDGTFYKAKVVARDTQLDIAILQIAELPERQLPVVKFGDSEALELGQAVIAIGNALAEFQNSVSLGVVSGLSRSIVASDQAGNSEYLNQVIQTDAAINPGNSGGPLLNLDGEVIGVSVATSRGADNIGFALPGHLVKEVVDSVREHGEIIRPYLGVRYVMVNQKISTEENLSVTYGALIVQDDSEAPAIESGSPADRAGLRSGDVIIALDKESLGNKDLATELRSKSVGEEVFLTIIRDGVEIELVAILERTL